MDKPITMSVKDYLIRLLSIKTNTPVKTIEAIVDHQFQGANEALKTNYSVEISGFGKFLFNHKKAHKKWEKNLSKKQYFENILKSPITEQKRISVQLKLENTIKWLENIKPKIETNEHLKCIGRVEEQAPAPQGVERTDRDSENTEVGHMQ